MSRSKKCRFNITNGLGFFLAFFVLSLAACGDQDGGVATLTLTANPASLPADGYSQSLLEATLEMANGEDVRDQTEVTFSIVKGEGKIIKTSRTTDGVAYATLQSSNNPGTAKIRAKAHGSIAEITVNYDDSGPAFITIADGFPDPASVNIVGTGGQATSLVVWELRDVYGELVGDGYRVDFEIIKSPGAGEFLEPTSATTREGQVSTVFRSGSKSGPVTIKATYHDDSSIFDINSQIAINGGPPAGEGFGIFADYYNISGLYLANLQDQISVNVADIYGDAVPDGTAISFKTYDTGGFFAPGMDVTEGGLATSFLRSAGAGTGPQPLEGFVSATAEADGGRTTHVTTIAVDPKDPNIMFVGTSGGGVYKSINGGSSWENVSRTSEHDNLGQNSIAPYINDISINPDNPEMVYAATGYEDQGHIYRSLDGGLTWNSNNPEEWGGLLRLGSAVLSVLCDDGSDYVWAGTRGDGIYYSTNGNSFQQRDIEVPNTVRDIEKASGTGASATVYAATPTGVYKTTNGGSTWTRKTSFKGDNITTVAVHPADSNTIYAGTQEYGVWYSTNGGDTWKQYNSGLGKGLKATPPIADDSNTGTGLMSEVTVGKGTETETWSVVYDGENEHWVVTGTTSGRQNRFGKTGQTYTSDKNEIGFLIMQGNTPFEDGDAFRFETVRDEGMNIKDLQVYHSVSDNAYYLYAITYSFGAQEHYAVGNVYSIALDSGRYYKPKASWQEANMNLPEIDPPMDNALLAQYALAVNRPDASSRLFVGGQGINFYKAVSGLNQGDPIWEESKIGLTNRIMARTPILFTGICTMNVSIIEETTIVDIVEVEVEGGEEGEVEEVEVISWDVTFQVYIQDRNGNPPISGSTFTVVQEVEEGDDITFLDIEYADVFTHPGTWPDRSDPSTDNPYIIQTTFSPGDKMVFTFEPTCGEDVPGCSGQDEELTYMF